jgi:hypothetical protein
MKKIVALSVLSVLLYLAFAVTVNAATPTPTPVTKPSKAALNEKLSEQINQLKEKIASRVSELNLVEKRGMIGTVSEVSGSKITLKDIQGQIRFVDVDEITKFSSASNKTFGLSDITKGTKISVLGLYNKQSKRILARFINVSVDPVFLNGSIIAVDTKNFFLTIKTSEEKEIKLDVQTSTKLNTYDEDDGLIKYGFSKFEVGDRITAIGFPDKKDPATIVPDRIIDLSGLSSNPKIVVPDQAASKSGTTR